MVVSGGQPGRVSAVRGACINTTVESGGLSLRGALCRTRRGDRQGALGPDSDDSTVPMNSAEAP